MSRLSEIKKQKISEQILHLLFEKYPQTLFTSQIAKEIARDEEFTKLLLHDLKQKQLTTSIHKNPKGLNYLRRIRWRLSNNAHKIYSNQNIKATDNL